MIPEYAGAVGTTARMGSQVDRVVTPFEEMTGVKTDQASRPAEAAGRIEAGHADRDQSRSTYDVLARQCRTGAPATL